MPISFKTELTEKKELAKSIYFFSFKLLDPKEIKFISGQYVFFKIGNVTRLYSIASNEQTNNQIDLIIKIHEQGIASRYFSNLKVGEKVDVYGPAGIFKLESNSKKKILIAFGTGITPFRSILKTLSMAGELDFDIKLFWGLKKAEDVYCLDEFEDIKKNNPKFEYNIYLSREQDFSNLNDKIYKKGRINNFIPRDGLDCEYYLCGQQEIVMALNLYLLSNGVNRENIFFEIY